MECRKAAGRESPETNVLDWNIDELNKWLPLFLTEIRRIDGTNFKAKTVFEYIMTIQSALLHLRCQCYGFLNDQVFVPIKNALDNRMKQLQTEGLGFNPQQADVITLEMEEALWLGGQLGSECPAMLLNTLVYMLGIHLGLRSGEHRKLRREMFCVSSY